VDEPEKEELGDITRSFAQILQLQESDVLWIVFSNRILTATYTQYRPIVDITIAVFLVLI
jgi:hypothetical protein